MTLLEASLHHRRTAGYGWHPSLPDARDVKMVVGVAKPKQKVDLRSQMPQVYGQLQLGSCTGNGIAGVLEYEAARQGEPMVTPSRLFIYYGEREIEQTISEDSGAQIRDGIKVVAKLGAPPESLWPYSDANPGVFQQKPSKAAYAEALKHKALKYFSCPGDAFSIQWCLSNGYPVVNGFTVYDSFESQEVANTGIMPMPDLSVEHILGGHCTVKVGFNASNKTWNGCPPNHYIERNSWTDAWGDAGYFYMPFEYAHDPNFCSDRWTIRLVK